LTLKVRTVFEKQIINFIEQFAHRNRDEGAACPREAQRSPGYPLQVRTPRNPNLGGLSVSIPCRCQHVVHLSLNKLEL
jgi:hypothetical protein